MSGRCGLEEPHAGGEHELRRDRRCTPTAAAARRTAARPAGRAPRASSRRPSPRKSTLRACPWPRSRRSLSLAVTTASEAPARAKARQDRLGAQILGIVHHHFDAGVGIVEVVAADPVHRRRRARDDREIVGIGEGRDHGIGQARRSTGQHRGQPRRRSARGRPVNVLGLAAVDTHHDERTVRPLVAPAIDLDRHTARAHGLLPVRLSVPRASVGAGPGKVKAPHTTAASMRRWRRVIRPGR